jgi:glycosyltransferase involved in cell wall biosynthesis/MoaA/NifB/PqqE/SkfB family radical SAM enzyme
MRLLLVIHGYPMRYNAGSEVYTQSLAHALAQRHEVRVFTRQEDPTLPAFASHDESDPMDSRIRLRVVNNSESRDRYSHAEIDAAFACLLDEFRPDVVHINHVSHLSTSMLAQVSNRRVPTVFTIHDFWLMCPRGQFIQRACGEDGEPFPLCSGQEDRKCADRCYNLYYSGLPQHRESDARHWTDWVRLRMQHVREMVGQVDQFIAPSRFVLERFQKQYGISPERVNLLDYGFDLARLSGRVRVSGEAVTFGYIGTHTPAKGIHHLVEAFGKVRGNPRLRIWGRHRDPYSGAIRRLCDALPNSAGDRIEWLGEYSNDQIVRDVLNRVDAIVVPSIWEENSPLVIHEAQQARVPVLTAAVGGMAEFVKHESNGLLFRHRDPASIAEQMQRIVDEPQLARTLGERGYAYSATGDVVSMEDHVRAVESVYRRSLQSNGPLEAINPGPWRITFDTSPDDCNLRCVMCEEHSPHSTLQSERRAAGQGKRRMDIGLVRKVLEESRGTPLREIIPSTMGEPLLYEHFEEILNLCNEFGVKLNLTTNGTFPKRGSTEWARLIVPVTSDVKISINGATAATQEAIMLGTRFDRLIQNVREFVAVRDQNASSGDHYCRVTFQTTFLESNVDELPDLVRLAASLGVNRVKGHHLWVHFTKIEGLSMRRKPESVHRWNAIVEKTRRAAEDTRLPSGKQVLLENIHPLDPEQRDEIAPGGVCPFLGQEAWVSAEGRFNPCCAPDAQRRTLGEFGNLSQVSIGEVWNGSPYQHLREHYLENRLCQTCNMRRPQSSP